MKGCSSRSLDRKSTRLNSSHVEISYAVFCLKKKKKNCSSTLLITIMHNTFQSNKPKNMLCIAYSSLSIAHSLHFVLHPTSFRLFFFFNDTATTEIYTLSLHDALPI